MVKENKTRTLFIRADEELVEALDAFREKHADEDGMDRSRAIRIILRDRLKKEGFL